MIWGFFSPSRQSRDVESLGCWRWYIPHTEMDSYSGMLKDIFYCCCKALKKDQFIETDYPETSGLMSP